MNVIFLAPNFPANQRQYTRALAQAGARVWGIGETPVEWLDSELKSWLYHYEQVPTLASEEAVLHAVHRCQARGWIHKMECTVEAHMLMASKVRELTGIPGVSHETTVLCRDKFVMKQHLRKHGIPCALNAEINSVKDAKDFLAQSGYPFILKPRAAAGAAGTYKVSNDAELEHALKDSGIASGRTYYTAEEFISGHEGFWDTISIDGEVVFEQISHYYPNVLEAMRTRWISPQIVTTNRLWSEGYNELRAFGRDVIKALGITTAATHMEWFYGPKGLSFSEIGCRPPGCNMWDVYCWANDFDLYLEWAKAIVYGQCDPNPSRRYSAGLVSLRPSQDGRVTAITGIDAVQQRCGGWIGKVHLTQPGSPTAPVEAGYIGSSYMHIRHPDYDECRNMLNFVGENLKVWAS
jgi:carbamoylphosphate synthase large subunit